MSENHHDYDLVCIGSGPAGQRAAIQAAKLGKRVAVVEKQQIVGGVCIESGTIPSKTFREAVRRGYSRPGLEAHEQFRPRSRPTMQQLVGHVERVIERELSVVQENLSRNDVEVIRGRASFVDAHTVLVEGHSRAGAGCRWTRCWWPWALAPAIRPACPPTARRS